jgi:hypothetical protein
MHGVWSFGRGGVLEHMGNEHLLRCLVILGILKQHLGHLGSLFCGAGSTT